jgi:alpha-tubulin suppressor-like RCC1 family protein
MYVPSRRWGRSGHMRHRFSHKRLVPQSAFNAHWVCVGIVAFIASFLLTLHHSYAQGLIATSISHTCALTKASDAGVKCWGNNSSGQLGDGTTTQRNQPVQVVGLTNGVAAVGVGSNFSCALLTSGQVKCWGANDSGQLGTGPDRDPSSVPVSVLASAGNPLTGVTSLSVGNLHTCVMLGTGGAKCWGDNQSGQLSDGTYTSRDFPEHISGNPGFSAPLQTIDAGQLHTCIGLPFGSLYCVGDNSYYQLGDGTSNSSVTPKSVSGLNLVMEVSAGHVHSCAVRDGGALFCWGYNDQGTLGDGTTTSRSTPVQINNTGATQVERVSAGILHTCATITHAAEPAGEVFCWGRGSEGQVGDGTSTQRNAPTALNPQVKAPVDIASQGDHSCAWMAECSVKCWGGNASGQIGDGTTVNAFSPVDISICSVDPTPTPTPTPTYTPTPPPTLTATPTPLPEACASEASCVPNEKLTTALDPKPSSIDATPKSQSVVLTMGTVKLGIPIDLIKREALRRRLSKFLGYKVTNIAKAIKSLQVFYLVSIVRAPSISSSEVEALAALPTKYKTETRKRRVTARLQPGTYVARVNIRLKDKRGRTFVTGKRTSQTTFTVR